jgi:hypothetical protein
MSFAVVTPTFRPDMVLCRRLHRSVLEYCSASVVHHLLVPDEDVAAFASLRSPRCVVWPESVFLPRRVRRLPRLHPLAERLGYRGPRIAAVNVRRPYPPVRGWILQQVLKLAAAREIGERIVVLVDSDVELVRPLSCSALVRSDGVVRLYRADGAIDERLPRHVMWHDVARSLLGLPHTPTPLPDYISSLNVWDRRLVAALQDRIERVNGKPWVDALAAQVHFSEWTLYGVFVDDVAGAPANSFRSSSALCHSYWDTTPLDHASAADFVEHCPEDDVAVLIQSKSGTPLEVRTAALRLLADRLAASRLPIGSDAEIRPAEAVRAHATRRTTRHA